tara:strand:+ start:20339 stop:20677 length:339 start_codon:yes stop_codon:yes gene_type:complete
MRLLVAAITAFILSAGIANAQQAVNMVQSYNAPPTQQELDAMANSGWNLISVVPVVTNGTSQYYVAYFDGLPPKASMGVNCTYRTLQGSGSDWFKDGPSDRDKQNKFDWVCR